MATVRPDRIVVGRDFDMAREGQKVEATRAKHEVEAQLAASEGSRWRQCPDGIVVGRRAND